MSKISKQDWKLFREKVPDWQESYMAKLNQSYIKLLSGKGLASEKFGHLRKKVNEDIQNPGVLIEMRKSEVVLDIASLIRSRAISKKEIKDFSPELRRSVHDLLKL